MVAMMLRVRKRRSMKVFTPASGTRGVGHRRGEVWIFKAEPYRSEDGLPRQPNLSWRDECTTPAFGRNQFTQLSGFALSALKSLSPPGIEPRFKV